MTTFFTTSTPSSAAKSTKRPPFDRALAACGACRTEEALTDDRAGSPRPPSGSLILAAKILACPVPAGAGWFTSRGLRGVTLTERPFDDDARARNARPRRPADGGALPAARPRGRWIRRAPPEVPPAAAEYAPPRPRCVIVPAASRLRRLPRRVLQAYADEAATALGPVLCLRAGIPGYPCRAPPKRCASTSAVLGVVGDGTQAGAAARGRRGPAPGATEDKTRALQRKGSPFAARICEMGRCDERKGFALVSGRSSCIRHRRIVPRHGTRPLRVACRACRYFGGARRHRRAAYIGSNASRRRSMTRRGFTK